MAIYVRLDYLLEKFQKEGRCDVWGGEYIRKVIAEAPSVEVDPVHRNPEDAYREDMEGERK